MSLEFVKLCAYNHVALDGFINGADETFQDYTSFFSKLIWIDFYNLWLQLNIIIKYSHTCEKLPTINKKWTPIEWKII